MGDGREGRWQYAFTPGDVGLMEMGEEMGQETVSLRLSSRYISPTHIHDPLGRLGLMHSTDG